MTPGGPAGGDPRSTPDRREVDRVFSAALDLPEDERAAFLSRECGSDAPLHAAVTRLLAAERASVGAFDAAAAANLRAVEEMVDGEEGEDPRLGQRLGAFRLVRRIGRGGMAVVYLAEREEGGFSQRVAVKLLRRSVDSADDVARFRAERQILSTLEHPHIARLVDGGTTPDGLPYLATEFVEGLPITEWCAGQALGIEQRLDLFLQVADAVHHAHQKLVVHRDLKPSNVMVDSAGRARLLDFGIAKLLEPGSDDDAPLTRLGHVVMTPEYAAPEQLGSGEVTTATDVYQLGVLLHEMLTGVRPERARPGDEDVPGTAARPSSRVTQGLVPADPALRDGARLARRLRGDLDVILQTALQHEPARRYASVAALAADVRSHLRGQPIAARPDTALDLLRRFARRSPLAVAAAALALALLVGWLVSLQFYSRELARERDVAEAQALRATRAYDLLLGVFRRADPLERDTVGGQAATVWDSLDASTNEARATLRNEPAVLGEILDTLSRLYRTGGQLERSRDLLLETLSLQRQVHGVASPEVAVTLGELGSVEAALGHGEAARGYLDEAVLTARSLPRDRAAEAVAVFLDAGHAAVDAGDSSTASRHFEHAESLLRESGRPDPNALIESLFGHGNALAQLGEAGRAEPLILEAVALTEEVYGLDHARLAGPLSALGGVQRRLGRHELAAGTLRRAIAIMEREYGDTYAGVLAARNNLALVLGDAGDRRGEQAELARLVALRRASLGEDHPLVADTLQNLGASLGKGGDYAAALAALAEARRIYDASLAPGSPRRAFPRLTGAYVHLQRGDAAAAAGAAGEAVAILEKTLPSGHFATGIAQCLQGEALLATGDAAGGTTLVRAAWPIVEKAPAEQADYIARCRNAYAPLEPAG